jgi:hypothetical protein
MKSVFASAQSLYEFLTVFEAVVVINLQNEAHRKARLRFIIGYEEHE